MIAVFEPAKFELPIGPACASEAEARLATAAARAIMDTVAVRENIGVTPVG